MENESGEQTPQEQQLTEHTQVWARRQTIVGAGMLIAEAALIVGETTGHVEASALANVVMHTVFGLGGLGLASSGVGYMHMSRQKT